MAYGIVKTEHSGAKNGGGAWMRRNDAKARSRKARRRNNKAIIREAVG